MINTVNSFSMYVNIVFLRTWHVEVSSRVVGTDIWKALLRISHYSLLVVVLLFNNVHGKHIRSCRDSQLTEPHFSWAGLDLLSG